MSEKFAYQPFVQYPMSRVIEKYENGQLIERIIEGIPPPGSYGTGKCGSDG